MAQESDERDHLSGRLAEKWGQKKRENTIAVSGLGVKIGHEKPWERRPKVSTHVLAPEARWRLAGGSTTGAKPVEPPSPGGATD